jgi:hypothetical protein
MILLVKRFPLGLVTHVSMVPLKKCIAKENHHNNITHIPLDLSHNFASTTVSFLSPELLANGSTPILVALRLAISLHNYDATFSTFLVCCSMSPDYRSPSISSKKNLPRLYLAMPSSLFTLGKRPWKIASPPLT